MDSPTNRIELPSGGWVTIRKLKVRDFRELRSTGGDTIDGVAILPRIITEWSQGPVTAETLDDMDLDDMQAILAVFNSAVPNGSTPSSDGSAADEGAQAQRTGS